MKSITDIRVPVKVKIHLLHIGIMITLSNAITFTSDKVQGGHLILEEMETATLVCTNSPYTGKHVFKLDSEKVSECNTDDCNEKTAKQEKDEFTFQYDMKKGVFFWVINSVRMKYDGNVFKCSDGTEMLRLTAKVIKKHALTFTSESVENGYLILGEKETATLVCTNFPYTGKHIWKIDSRTIGECNGDYCTDETIETKCTSYTFEYDTKRGVFLWVIHDVTMPFDGSVFKCSDGTETLSLTASVIKKPPCVCRTCIRWHFLSNVVFLANGLQIIIKLVAMMASVRVVFSSRWTLSVDVPVILYAVVVGIVAIRVGINAKSCDSSDCDECVKCYGQGIICICFAILSFIVVIITAVVGSKKKTKKKVNKTEYAVQLKLTRTSKPFSVTDPDFRDIIESDNLLAPMWQARRFRLDSTNRDFIMSNGPVWITRMQLLLELTEYDKEKIGFWKAVANEIVLEKGEIFVKKYVNKEQEQIADWNFCVKDDCKIGLVHMMKNNSFLPNRLQLAQACKKFGRKSSIIRIISQIICDSIKTSDKDIVWPAYRKEDENEIIFVKIGEDQTSAHSKYNIIYWNKDCVSSENKEVILKEVESKTMIDCDEMKQIKKVINDKSKWLRENHSNISMITASPFRSNGFKTLSHKLEKENCIVLLVPIKGIIPLQEEMFDKTIEHIKTDVREGIFKWYVGGKPSEKHAELKIGCAIGPAMKNVLGTLGGFVEHPKYGLCGLTCAHVLLDDRVCVQPNCTDDVFGTSVTKILQDSDTDAPGLDIALIKIENRPPVDGSFPDMEKDDKRKAGFNENDDIRYTTGQICKDLLTYRDRRIVKYGARTFLRRGVFAFDGVEFAYYPIHYPIHYLGKPELVLKNQVQINDISNCGRFSDEGDSGSLVFIVSDNNELVAAGLLIGGCDGLSVMTPIRDVLLGIGCPEPLSMKTFPDTEQMEI